MRLSTFTNTVFIFLFAAFFSGCLKDNVTPPLEVPLSDSGKLLFYLERKRLAKQVKYLSEVSMKK